MFRHLRTLRYRLQKATFALRIRRRRIIAARIMRTPDGARAACIILSGRWVLAAVDLAKPEPGQSLPDWHTDPFFQKGR